MQAASPEDLGTSSVRVSEASQLAEASTRVSAETDTAEPNTAESDTAAQPLAEGLQASLAQADAEHSPAELATSEPEHTVSEASEQPISSDADADAAESEVHSEADTETSESEDNDDLLAQLSESMWASLRPEAQSREALGPPSTSGRELKAAGTNSVLSAALLKDQYLPEFRPDHKRLCGQFCPILTVFESLLLLLLLLQLLTLFTML